MAFFASFMVTRFLLTSIAAVYGQQVYLTLGSTNITNNNTEIHITDIGEDSLGGLPSLTCHTDLTACCRGIDTGGRGGLGEWHYPDGSVVPNHAAWEDFYRVRNAPQVVRLARRRVGGFYVPTGSYCCVIPTTGGEMTFCANLVVCPSLSLTKGAISYSDPALGVGSVATHSCVLGFDPIESSSANTRTCQSDGTWSGRPLMCIWKVVCPPLFFPTNGRISYSDPTLGVETIATHSCDSRYSLSESNVTRTCQSDGTWSGSALFCKVGCGQPAAPLNGQVETPDGTAPGKLAHYVCDIGYSISGLPSRYCLPSLSWVPQVPTCNIVNCGQLSAPINGNVTSPNTTYNSVATYSCDRGYMLDEEISRTCQTDGNWSNTQPECIPVNCTNLTDPLNGYVVTTGTTYLSEANYSCNSGYRVNGSAVRTCGPNGQWSFDQPRCQPVDCGALSAPSNGRVDTPSGTNFTSVANYSCDLGYSVNGSMYRICEANGSWAPNPPPSCQVVDCGELVDPTRGHVNTQFGTTYNSNATYSCVEGYWLIGTARRICNATGEWLPSAPYCAPVDCGALYRPDNGHIDTSQGTIFNSIAIYSCDRGYNLTGCTDVKCLSTGKWSCNPPFCADNIMIQLKFGPTRHCVEWNDWKVELMYTKLQSLLFKAIQRAGHVIPKENIQRGYFSCYRSTTETTYRTTITGTERVSAVDYAGVIKEWVVSGVTTRVQWYVIKIDKNCPVSITSMDDDECE